MNLDRIFRTQPQKSEEQVGVAFVSILFGVVVGLMVSQLAGDIARIFYADEPANSPRIYHLMTAIFLTTLSFLGYFASRHNPRHRIYFFNWPFCLFVLDVLMVFVYYLVLQFAESTSGNLKITADARPEAILVAAAFFLYSLWDWFSWRISRDAEYRKAIGQTPKPPADVLYGARRWVTVVFTIVTTAFALWVFLTNPSRVESVDVFLIVMLVLYRVAKPLFDNELDTRS